MEETSQTAETSSSQQSSDFFNNNQLWSRYFILIIKIIRVINNIV